jgi:hypothetical protein
MEINMRIQPAATRVLAAALLFSAPSFAHHAQTAFDRSQEILIEGTVARFDWVNPHMYLIVDTTGPDGEPAQVMGEGLAITQALVDGLDRDALRPGTPVVMRANPNRGGWGKQVRILDVTTQDGEIHPFYATNLRTRSLTPAESLEGHWAPSTQSMNAAWGAARSWPVTAEGRAAQAERVQDGLCIVEPVPFLATLNEMRTIDVSDDEVVIHYDNSGDHAILTIPLNAEHPANVEPSVHGHAVGWWEGDTLVIDRVGFEPNPWGLMASVPSSEGKHTVERLSLTEDGLRLRYEITVEDPVYLEEPASLSMLWDHRPDLELSPPSQACDHDVAARFIEDQRD